MLHFEKLTSTNDYAKHILANNTPNDGTVILADFQESGKGQQGNKWESNEGENLLFSIILFPKNLLATDQFFLNMAISIGILNGLEKVLRNNKLAIKWPNDILVEDKKIAGVLIENSIEGSSIKSTIAGIGLNVNQQKFEVNFNSISIKNNTEQHSDLQDILEILLKAIEQQYILLQKRDMLKLKNAYLAKMHRNDGEYYWYEANNIKFEAKILDITSSGKLILEDKSRQRSEYIFKQVRFI